MAIFDVGKSTLTEMNAMTDLDFSVAPKVTDAAQQQDETPWQNPKASQYLGYYKSIPEFKNSVAALTLYSIGQGWTADPETKVILEHITGWGEDTINSIFDNLLRCKKVYGDAYAEIIKDKETGILINLKVLDPSSMRHIVNREGKIKRYEQFAKSSKDPVQKFEPKEILHLCNDRIADEIHGTSLLEAVEWIILAKNEAMADRKIVFHRNVTPLKIIYVDTDNQGKIDELKAKYQTQIRDKEVMIVPKDTMKIEIPVVPIVDSESWIKYLDNAFYEAVGVPKVIIGGSQEFTEASSKIAFVTFQQIYTREQEELKADLWNQLQLKVEFNKPVSLMNELLSSQQKNTGQTGFQPNDVQVGAGK